MNRPLVEIERLSKRFGDFVALDSLHLTIPSGCLFALLGPNGAGKTTTLKLMMGMLRPTNGAIRICGRDAFRDAVAVKSRIGYLPDEPTFYDFLRGREILRFVGDLRGIPRLVQEERTAALAERLNLSDALDEFAENYSRGMKKKLGLICALLHQPDLMILDEPTNGLDPHTTLVLHELMRESAAAGRTVLFSTHLLEQAERLCDRVAVMNRGRLAAEGTLNDLRARFEAGASLETLFFELTSPSSAPSLGGAMKEATR